MRRTHPSILLVVTVLLCSGWLQAQPVGQNQSKAGAVSVAQAAGSCPTTGADPLNKVLDSMDGLARRFSSVRADFIWDQYESVVNEHTVQAGVMWVRKTAKGIEMAADIRPTGHDGQQKYVVFSGGKVQVYQPGIDQLTEYSAGKNREALESFLVLGFGGGGHDLCKQFSIAYAGRDNVQGRSTDKLELTPLKPSVRGLFERIILWIDSEGISVQQRFIEPSTGNYRLATYSNIDLHAKVRDEVFKVKITPKTQIIHQ